MTLGRNRFRLLAVAITATTAGGLALGFHRCGPVAASPPSMEDLVRRASNEAGVPARLLWAMAYAETRFVAESSPDGRRGWIRLVPWKPQRSSRRAAELIGVPTLALESDPAVSLRGAAALLAEVGRPLGLGARTPVAAWRPALEQFNDGQEALADAVYAEQVVRIAETDAGMDVPHSELPFDSTFEATRVGARWVPFLPAASSAYQPFGAEARTIRYIVLHTTQNTFSNILGYFRVPGTQVGAHYLLRASDGFALQLIDERAVAFHDRCFNKESIGIEHEGYIDFGSRWYSQAMYRASAHIVRDVARRHGIPIDRKHILGHGETPDCSEHTDPGPDWDWDQFMALVRETDATAGDPK